MSNRIHELKTWPEPFEAMAEGRKPFEVRWDDRDFRVGDYLLLQEYIPGHDPGFTGREIMRQVTFVLAGGQFDLPVGVVVMGLVDHGRVDALERELLRCSEHLRDFAVAHPMESSTDIDGALYCAEQLLNRTPAESDGETTDLTVDQIDQAVSDLIVRGPHGPAAGVNLARVAGRALKMLHAVVGPRAALVAAESLVANLKSQG